MTLVFGNIRCMRFLGNSASNNSGVVHNDNFRRFLCLLFLKL